MDGVRTAIPRAAWVLGVMALVENGLTDEDVLIHRQLGEIASRLSASRAYLLQACLLAKRCVSYTLWGFTDRYSWVPGVFDGEGSATPLDENLTPKPAYAALRDTLALAGR